MRVLHCPDTVGGQAGALAAAERELGLDSLSVALVAGPLGHEVDEVLAGPRSAGRPGPAARLRFEAARWNLVRRALGDFDVVHFNFGRTILPGPVPGPAPLLHGAYAAACAFLDLRLLRRAGKGIVVTFQGDDARCGDTVAARRPGSLPAALPDRYTPAADAARRRSIAAFERHAHSIRYLNPDLAWSLPRRARFLPYAVPGAEARPGVEARPGAGHRRPPGDPLVVVHAPTDRAVKGTSSVEAAVAALAREGFPVELRLLEGLPRAAVREALRQADIVVDQLLAGWYGAFAVEAMAAGAPVVSRIEAGDLDRVPPGLVEQLPVVDAQPGTLADVLRPLLADPVRRAELGERGRAFAARWHDPAAVAREIVADYEAALDRR